MNLVQKTVQQGGKLRPLIIPAEITGGTGLMNPSPFVDDDGDILLILRHINYTLYHAENNQRFPSIWGPLSYLHPEKDQHLRTTNFVLRLDKDLNVINETEVEMLNFLKGYQFITKNAILNKLAQQIGRGNLQLLVKKTEQLYMIYLWCDIAARLLIILQTTRTPYELRNKSCNTNIIGYPLVDDVAANAGSAQGRRAAGVA